jgi:exportin-T
MEANFSSDLAAKALSALRDLFPLLLRFLSDEYDDTSMAVFPFLNELFFQVHPLVNLAKLTSKSRRSVKVGVEVFNREFLQALLQALFQKLRYDNEAQTLENDDSGEEAEFHDLRKRLLSFQDSIGAIDPELYSRSLGDLITSTFQAMNSGSSQNWRDVEVALFEMHVFAEPLKGNEDSTSLLIGSK